eukprot:355906-Chlamydomonas_euryale.AAC.3
MRSRTRRAPAPLLALLAAAALAVAAAQVPPTGIFYWCSMCEDGPNMAPAETPCIPRWVGNALRLPLVLVLVAPLPSSLANQDEKWAR